MAVSEDRFPEPHSQLPDVIVRPDIAYSILPGFRPLRLDDHAPAASSARPLIIFGHGGGWTIGTKCATGNVEDGHLVLVDFAWSGYAFASVEYGLSGEVPYPSAVIDVKDAIRFPRSNAGHYGIDPDRVSIWGGSAGAHLAAMAATNCNDPAFLSSVLSMRTYPIVCRHSSAGTALMIFPKCCGLRLPPRRQNYRPRQPSRMPRRQAAYQHNQSKETQVTNVLRRQVLVGMIASAVLAPTPTLADAWELLGERKVWLSSDHDVIPVTLLRGDFRRLMIKVAGKGVFFDEVAVTYGNGAVDRLPIRAFIEAGGQTRVIDLRGGDRIIKTVEIFYRSVPTSLKRASVRVYAR